MQMISIYAWKMTQMIDLLIIWKGAEWLTHQLIKCFSKWKFKPVSI